MASGRGTIKTRISLEGGREILEQLRQLGQTGEKAFNEIQAAAKKIDLANLGKAAGQLRGDLATFGKRVALGFAAVTTAATATGLALAKLAGDGAKAADEAGKAAQRTGLQVEAYGRLAYAADLADVSQEKLTAGMSRLNKAIGEAAKGSKNSVDLFRRLGVSIRDAQGKLRPAEAILQDVSQTFARLPDGAIKSALAIELFGKSGADLLPLLNTGKQGLIDLGKEAERLGLTFTKEQVAVAEAMNDTLSALRKTANGIRLHLGLIFAPTITQGAAALRDAIANNRQAILAFANELASRVTPLIEDFIAILSGRDQDVRNPWMLEWRDAATEFAGSVKTAFQSVIIPAFEGFRKVLETVSEEIRRFTGIDLGASGVAMVLMVGQLTGAFRVLVSTIRVAYAALLLFGRHPIIAGITAIGAGIAIWAARTDEATSAMEAHEGAVNNARTAYERVGQEVAKMAQGVKDGILLEQMIVFEKSEKALSGALSQLKSELLILSQQEGIGPIVQQFLDGITTVEQFKDAVTKFGIDNPELARDAQEIVNWTKNAIQLSSDLRESGNWIDLLTGKIDDATFRARQLGETLPQIGEGADAIKNATDAVGQGADDAKTKVDGLAESAEKLITVTGSDGKKTQYNIAAQLGQSAQEAKPDVDALGTAAEDAQKKTESAFGVIRSVPQELRTVQAEAGAVFSEMAGDAESAGDAIGNGLTGSAKTAQGVFSNVRAGIVNQFNSLRNSVLSVINSLEAALRRLQAAIAAAKAQAAAARSGRDESGGAGFAVGGRVFGPGTSTSDSIPARLSVGEFVTRARAVRYYGADLFHALNQMKLPKGFLKAFRGFSLGGLASNIEHAVSVAPLRFAGGGMVPLAASGPSGRPVNVTIGSETFAMFAPEDVAEKFMRFASQKGIRSTGRKPSWKGGL